ncbi:MAG: efflux RND transporter periplasmic adaptor subunit, partial [Bacteroidota bacterium]
VTTPEACAYMGKVTQRRVAVGDHLREGDPLFDVINLNRVWVLFDAYEADLPAIVIGSTIDFNTPALPNQNFQAQITFIDPVIDPQSRVASVRVEVANSRALLKPEMLVYGTMESKKAATQELVIPKSAVMWTGTQSVVYVKVPAQDIPSFQFREVSLGEAIGDSYQITAGLATGEEVVTHGSFVIDAAAQLNNQASMMNQQVGIKKETKVMALPDYSGDTPLAFQEQLVLLANGYLLIKDALVDTDAATATSQATTFLAQLATIDSSPLKDEALDYWQEQQNALKAHAQNLQATTDVEEQRYEFDFLSEVIIANLKVFGSSEEVFYVQYCPMAFDDTGANWLSAEDKVLNPYFGDKMLRCGIVKETISGD